MRFEHSEPIAAPADIVWRLTLDIERWPQITPTVAHVERLDEGELAVGSRARLRQPGQRPATWTVTEIDHAQRRFAWSSKVFGVTTLGVHEVRDASEGCVNLLAIEMSGRGAPLVARLGGRAIRKALADENSGYRAAAERSTGR
jgi:uncharacterized membrane protein